MWRVMIEKNLQNVSQPSFSIPPSLYGESQAGTPKFPRSSSEDSLQDMTVYLLTLQLTDLPTFLRHSATMIPLFQAFLD